MSFDSMIADEPKAVALRPAIENETDEAGLPIHGLVMALGSIPGRLSSPSAKQVAAWLALAIEVSMEFFTSESRIENGWFLEVDGRRWRVTGVRRKRYAKGTLPDIWMYPLIEADRGDGQ